MSFYTSAQRGMQEQYGTCRLADAVEAAIVWTSIDEANLAFIESRDFFFLSTVDGEGRPTVSYKGGPVGIVRGKGPTTLIFPAYDGNGMFKSLGNISDTGKVGLLFIDLETPNRLRVQGAARVFHDHPELNTYPGAIGIVEVAVECCFLNCARYIHRHARVATSPYVPAADGSQPHPSWKRIDALQEVMSPEDRARTQAAGGTITSDEYNERVSQGRS